MNIILTQDVQKLGHLGDEITVKNGYARNFLIPQGFALPITKANQSLIEHTKSMLAAKRKASIEESQTLAAKLGETTVEFAMKAGESGKLFGAVTQKQITEALHELGIDLSKKMMQLAQPLKTLGTHEIPVKLHTEVMATIKVKVSADEIVKAEKPVEEEAVEAPSEEDDVEETEEGE